MTTIGSSTSVNPMPTMHVRGGGGHGGKGLLSTDTDATTDPFTDSLTTATSTAADATTTAAGTPTTAASALTSTVATQLQNLLGIA